MWELFIIALPVVAGTKPAITFKRVVLPQPDGPMTQRNSFSSTVRLMSPQRLDGAVAGPEDDREIVQLDCGLT